MRAVVAARDGGPEVLELRDVTAPEPGPFEVLLRVVATSVNRADLNQRAGRSARPSGETLGIEASGHVCALGAEVEGWSVGDRVCTLLDSGGYAELAVASADLLIPVPASMDLVRAGAFAEVFLTAFDALEIRARAVTGETVLVHGGAGGLGTATIQLAVAMGCHVIATVRREAQAAACREMGADAWRRNHAVLAHDGRMVVLGTLTGSRVEFDLKDLMCARQSLFGAT